MKIIVSVGIQFMMKDRKMDRPTMLPRTTHDYSMDVNISPELEPFLPEYLRSVSEPDYIPSYNVGKELIKMITPRVRKAYPDHWREEVDENGKVTKFKPSDDTILESAIAMDVDDKIDDMLAENTSEVLESMQLEYPPDDEQNYSAGAFLTNLGWKLA